jgi:hypothetical protein
MESGQLSFINEKLKEENAGNGTNLYYIEFADSFRLLPDKKYSRMS